MQCRTGRRGKEGQAKAELEKRKREKEKEGGRIKERKGDRYSA